MNARHAAPNADGSFSVDVLGRVIALIEAIAVATGPLGVSALARTTGIPKTTVHRLLAALQAHQMLTRQRTGYDLGPSMRRLVRLAHGRGREDLRHLVMPYLVELYEHTGDAVMLGILDAGTVIVLETVRGRQHERSLPPLTEFPAHCSAIGKLLIAQQPRPTPPADSQLSPCTARSAPTWAALLRELPLIRTRGLSVCRGELLDGYTEIAMPLIGVNGAVAAIGRLHRTGPQDTAGLDIHRRIVVAASAALRREDLPHQRRPTVRKPQPVDVPPIADVEPRPP